MKSVANDQLDPQLLRSPVEWIKELDQCFIQCREATQRVSSANRANTTIAHQAEWHLRGLHHHMRRMLDAYTEFAHGVGSRAQIDSGADVLIMYAPRLQEVLFEFYALVNLARISLDNLRLFLRPVFKTPFGQLPKSISGFLEGWSDCPIYESLKSQSIVTYLADVRNCLVHFRTFATGDNALVIADHVDPEEEAKLVADADWFRHMARARFRRVEHGISVNVLLPDKIFDHSGSSKKLVPFTYELRINILSQTMNFVRLVWQMLCGVFNSLLESSTPRYTFTKRAPA